MSLWAKIIGTITSTFQVGLGGPLWNANAGNLEARNAANAAFVIGRGAPPVGSNDWVTLGSLLGAGHVQEIRFAIGTAAAQNSATSIPNGSIVVDAELDIVTPYSAGTTIEIGNAGNAALLMPTGDNTPTIAGLYQDHQDTAFAGGPATVLVTVGGAPAAGAGFCIVRYVQTPQA
jgi:hypothetical protein